METLLAFSWLKGRAFFSLKGRAFSFQNVGLFILEAGLFHPNRLENNNSLKHHVNS